MRRLFAVAVAALTLSVAAPVAHAKEASLAQDLRAINDVLATRAHAQVRHDRDAFASTIDPMAPAEFRDEQLHSFEWMTALPVAALDYEARVDLAGDLTRGVDRAHYRGAKVLLPETLRTMRFAFDGNQSAVDDMWWTYVQRDGKWYVGGAGDVSDVGLEPSVSMWDRGPVVMVQSEHAAMVAHAADGARAQALLANTEQALATLRPRFPLAWTGTIVGFLPESPQELTELLQSSVDVTKYVAFVSYAFDPETYDATAPRLYVQDTNLRTYPQASQVETLVHELTHAASSRYAGGFTPAWVHEGIADWVAIGPDVPARRASGSGDVAPRDDQFGAGSQGQIVQAYRDARSLIAALSRIAGRDAPFRFFEALGTPKIRPGGRTYVVDEALRKLGVNGLADLEAQWRRGR